MTLTIQVDPERCVCAMRCAYLAPTVFEISDDGYAMVTDPTSISDDQVIDAASQCPNMAITVVNGKGEKIVG